MYYASIPSRQFERATAQLRLLAKARGAWDGDVFWIRLDELEDATLLQLRSIPDVTFFVVEEHRDGYLRQLEDRLPSCSVPDLDWSLLPELMPVKRPVGKFAGQLSGQIPVALVRSTQVQPASVLLASFADWQAFAFQASFARLEQWRFAVDDEDRTVIAPRVGLQASVPPLPGDRFWVSSGIAVPCGYDLSPQMDFDVLAFQLPLKPGDMLLISSSGGWEVIKADEFVLANRSAIHATAQPGN